MKHQGTSGIERSKVRLLVAGLSALAALVCAALLWQHSPPTLEPGAAASSDPLTTTPPVVHDEADRDQQATTDRLALARPTSRTEVAPATMACTVRCQEHGTGRLLAGIDVFAYEDPIGRVAGPVPTNAAGLATLAVPLPASDRARHVQGRDPRGVWLQRLVERPRGRRGAPLQGLPPLDPDGVTVLDFVEVLVADLEFVGDEVLTVNYGHPGALDGRGVLAALEPAVGRVGGNQEPQDPGVPPLPARWRFFFSPPEKPLLAPVLVVTAQARVHGECVFSIPIVRATIASPVLCDLRRFPERRATDVTIEVVDRTGARVDIGIITFTRFTRRGKPPFRICYRSNATATLPSGSEYELELGDFPFVYRTERQTLDCRGTEGQTLLHRVALAGEMASRNIVFRLDGGPVAPHALWCEVHTFWADPSRIQARGCKSYVLPDRIDSRAMPLGDLDMTVRSVRLGLFWGVRLNVTESREDLIVDLKRTEGMPIRRR